MKKLFKILMLPLSLACVLLFGGWTTQQGATENRYADASLISTYASETISFSSRKVDSYYTPDGFPLFTQASGMTNACGAVAGAGIISYYDKYYNDLIPDWDSYYPASGRYRLQDSAHIEPMMWDLYYLMNTNGTGEGVTEQEFLNGFQAYVKNRGYNVNMQNVVSGSSFDYTTYKNAINNNKVVALLANPGDIYTFAEYNNYDIIATTNIAGPHIMVAYGYYDIKYYDASGKLFRNDIYLEVATGLSALQTAFYKINPHNLTASYIVNIS